ncbi:hypothetical protein ACP4OV_030453 [Aristida adscensionis]
MNGPRLKPRSSSPLVPHLLSGAASSPVPCTRYPTKRLLLLLCRSKELEQSQIGAQNYLPKETSPEFHEVAQFSKVAPPRLAALFLDTWNRLIQGLR